MRYKPCPHCGASNRARDQMCYSCEKDFGSVPEPVFCSAPPVKEVDFPSTGGRAEGKEINFTSTGGAPEGLNLVVTILLSSVLGAFLGIAMDIWELDIPFFLVTVLLGVVCASVAALCLCKFQELHETEYKLRVPPATAFGSLVGLCLFAIWWSFDPPYGFVAIGGIAGFCSGVPVAVSFGLFGGESRPLGMSEFMNVIVSLLGGAVLAAIICLDEFDFDFIPGVAGLIGLIPTLVGGRINMVELGSRFTNWD